MINVNQLKENFQIRHRLSTNQNRQKFQSSKKFSNQNITVVRILSKQEKILEKWNVNADQMMLLLMIFHVEKIVSTESVLLNVQIDADLERYDSYHMAIFVVKRGASFR